MKKKNKIDVEDVNENEYKSIETCIDGSVDEKWTTDYSSLESIESVRNKSEDPSGSASYPECISDDLSEGFTEEVALQLVEVVEYKAGDTRLLTDGTVLVLDDEGFWRYLDKLVDKKNVSSCVNIGRGYLPGQIPGTHELRMIVGRGGKRRYSSKMKK